MKIKVNVDFKSPELKFKNEFDGTFIDSRIIYIDDSIKTIIDLDKEILIRENYNDGYKIELDFKNNMYKVYIKENDSYVPLNIVMECFEHKENKVKIVYYYDDNKENKIEYNLEYINV